MGEMQGTPISALEARPTPPGSAAVLLFSTLIAAVCRCRARTASRPATSRSCRTRASTRSSRWRTRPRRSCWRSRGSASPSARSSLPKVCGQHLSCGPFADADSCRVALRSHQALPDGVHVGDGVLPGAPGPDPDIDGLKGARQAAARSDRLRPSPFCRGADADGVSDQAASRPDRSRSCTGSSAPERRSCATRSA